MVLLPMIKLLKKAQKESYAIGYFESWNLESTRAVVDAAEEAHSPVIIGFGGSLLAASGHNLRDYAAVGKILSERTKVPTALLLNEALDFQQIKEGIKYGFSSVMFDGSFMPYEENIKLTRKIADACHSMGVSVEGQLDRLPHAKYGRFKEDIVAFLTDPEKAANFVNQTGIDALSISVGNIHSLYKEKAKIDFHRVEKIRELIDVPLVIHGATGISDTDVQKLVSLGVCKINLGTELRLNFINSMIKVFEKGNVIFPEDILGVAEQELKNLVKKKMRVYRCSFKA
ncbi:MAG: class II fructose-bisphosphate aldolase [Candidatus Bathyarchaeia archaeon]